MVTLRDLRRDLGEGMPPGRSDDDGVRRQWWAALATLQDDLLTGADPPRGIWLAAPLPALYAPELLRGLRGWVWAPKQIGSLLPTPPMLPGEAAAERGVTLPGLQRLPLRDEDGTDPLLIVITPAVQVALAIEGTAGARRLLVRFDAPAVSAALHRLDLRLQEDEPAQAPACGPACRSSAPCTTIPSWRCGSGPGWRKGWPPWRRASPSSPWCALRTLPGAVPILKMKPRNLRGLRRPPRLNSPCSRLSPMRCAPP